MATRKKNGWTLERRYLQSLRIQEWRPWLKSTGPRTYAGKARASLNGCKADTASDAFLRQVAARAVRLEKREQWLKDVVASMRGKVD